MGRTSVLPRCQGPGRVGRGDGGAWPHVCGASSLLMTATPSGPQLLRRQQGPQGVISSLRKGGQKLTPSTRPRPVLGYTGHLCLSGEVPGGVWGRWEAVGQLQANRAQGSDPGGTGGLGTGHRGVRGPAWRGRVQSRPFSHWVQGWGLDSHLVLALKTESPSGSLPTSQFRGNPRPTQHLQRLQGLLSSLPIPAEGGHGALRPRPGPPGQLPRHPVQGAPWPATHPRPTRVRASVASHCGWLPRSGCGVVLLPPKIPVSAFCPMTPPQPKASGSEGGPWGGRVWGLSWMGRGAGWAWSTAPRRADS